VLTLTEREEDLQECLPKFMPASWLQGLFNAVPSAAWEQVWEVLHWKPHGGHVYGAPSKAAADLTQLVLDVGVFEAPHECMNP